MCVCTELMWGSFLAVASARVVRTFFVEWWESISLVIRELLLVICYLRIAVTDNNNLWIQEGLKKVCLGCPIARLLSELVARYYSLSITIPRSSYPCHESCGLSFVCHSYITWLEAQIARILYLGSLIITEGFVNLTLVFVCTFSHL